MNPAQLDTERAAWLALRDALIAEENALVEGEIERVEALAEAKEKALRALAERVRARLEMLVAAQLPKTAAGVARWLADAPDAQRALWREIVALEAETRAINQRNGGLIEQRLNLARQALNVLQGAAAARGNLYDQRGQKLPPGGGRTLNAA